MGCTKWILGENMKIQLDHIGIAVSNLDDGSNFWTIMGLVNSETDEVNEEQGVKIRFMGTDDAEQPPRIELLEPINPNTPVGKFITKYGEGVQQVAFRVDDLDSMIERLKSNDIVLINDVPMSGANDSRVVFVHPKSTGGVLVELLER